MEIIKLILTFLFGIFMMGNGMYHFSKPTTYFPFIPNFLPKEIINYIVATIEILVGIPVFIPQTRYVGTLMILIMMLIFEHSQNLTKLSFMLLANRIRNIREAHKLTQNEVADKCNISPSTYGKIERKAGSSSFDTLTKVAKAIGVNVSFLVDISNPNYLQ